MFDAMVNNASVGVMVDVMVDVLVNAMAGAMIEELPASGITCAMVDAMVGRSKVQTLPQHGSTWNYSNLSLQWCGG